MGLVALVGLRRGLRPRLSQAREAGFRGKPLNFDSSASESAGAGHVLLGVVSARGGNGIGWATRSGECDAHDPVHAGAGLAIFREMRPKARSSTSGPR